VRAVGFKPAETGVVSGEPSDSEALARACGVDEPLARPLLRLAEPLAPAVAAERAGTTLDPAAVEARVAALRAKGYTLVVEGAGGVLVPLAWGYTVLDLAARTGLEAVVVARPGLGTLNHAALTVDALRARNIAVRGVVLNGRSTPPDLAEETNPGALARLVPGVAVVTVGRGPGADPLDLARHAQAAVAGLL
jgi:dethiobiotin synthetase